MKAWLSADIALLVAMIPCAVFLFRAKRLTDCLVALQMMGIIAVLALLVLAQAMQRPSFYDLSLTLALLSFPAGLMYAHFVESWLP